jgi:FkbM family methyltransferase
MDDMREHNHLGETASPTPYWRDAAHYAKRALLSHGRVTLAGRTYRVAYESRNVREEADFALLSRLATGRRCIFDIGANMGATTLVMMSAAHRRGRVFAFEASESSCLVLRENITLNGMADRVTVVNGVLAEASGLPAEFHWESVSPQASIVHASPTGRSISVHKPTISIDDYVSSTGVMPDFVKIDVEGAERRVLAGMKDTLRKCQAAVIVELHAWPTMDVGQNAQSMQPTLADIGYRMIQLDTLKTVRDASAFAGFPESHRGVQFRSRALLLPEDMPVPEAAVESATATTATPIATPTTTTATA